MHANETGERIKMEILKVGKDNSSRDNNYSIITIIGSGIAEEESTGNGNPRREEMTREDRIT